MRKLTAAVTISVCAAHCIAFGQAPAGTEPDESAVPDVYASTAAVRQVNGTNGNHYEDGDLLSVNIFADCTVTDLPTDNYHFALRTSSVWGYSCTCPGILAVPISVPGWSGEVVETVEPHVAPSHSEYLGPVGVELTAETAYDYGIAVMGSVAARSYDVNDEAYGNWFTVTSIDSWFYPTPF